MTIQPDEEELHVIPNAGAPGTAGAGFRAPHPSPAEQAVIERFGIFEPEETVERVARAICEADFDVDGCRWSWDDADWPAREDYRRMARAALAALRGNRAPLAGQHTTDEEADR